MDSHDIEPPIWIYECSSGPATNPGCYQTILIRDGWRVLTPHIKRYFDWVGSPTGRGAVVGFHLPFGHTPGEMDFDAGLYSTVGAWGSAARRLASTFPRYMRAILDAYTDCRILVYLGGLVACESMNRVLVEDGCDAWQDRVDAILDPLLATDRVDLAIDNTSGLDVRGHIGMYAVRKIEEAGVRLYVEGVPTPRPGKRVMLARDCICTEPNWTRAIIDTSDKSVDARLLTGRVVRWFNGHFYTPDGAAYRHNAFGDDPVLMVGDVTRRGHRLASDMGGLVDHIGAKDFGDYRRIATAALSAA